MVKPDPKHDYYADLEIPASSDVELVKRQFRLLAKQYHPDRNPGHEVECVPKFQAVRAAHEILSDPDEKAKYDQERAKLLRKNEPDPYSFKRSHTTKVAPHNGPFAPPTRPRNHSVDTSARTQQSSASAEKFAAFARAAPQTQQWDRTRYEDHARNFQSMRGQQPPRPPPRVPTAPKPTSSGPSPDFGSSPGFPGVSRTQSGRPGYSPATPGSDGPPAPPKSAYAHVRTGKPAPSSSYPYPPPPSAATQAASLPSQRTRPSASPLRQSQAGGLQDAQRPAFGRAPSHYTGKGGERTNINGLGAGRSASVRTSPVDRTWPENGPFGSRSTQESSSQPPPRHRSESPKAKTRAEARYDFSSSSGGDDEPEQPKQRPKATPRRFRPQVRRASENDPALTGHFPSTGYTKVVDDDQYQYPPPESHETPYRRPFDSSYNPVDDIAADLDRSGIKDVHSKYETPVRSPFWKSSTDVRKRCCSGPTIRGIPAWALPSSVYPETPTVRPAKSVRARTLSERDFAATSDAVKYKHGPIKYANLKNSQSNARANGATHDASTHAQFSASEWDGKFANGGNVFRPSERDRASPSKTSRPKPPRPRVYQAGSPGEDTETDASPTKSDFSGVPLTEPATQPKSSAFQAGVFSADDWAERLRGSGVNPAREVPRRRSQENTTNGAGNDHRSQYMPPPPQPNANADAMDVDSPGITPITPNAGEGGTTSDGRFAFPPSTASTMDMNELKHTTPLAPSAQGLNSVEDLSASLPFTSRPSETVYRPPPSSHLKSLNLPKAPKPIIPPGEEGLTQETWSEYSKKMSQYMHDWNVFNCKMLDHFRVRIEQVNLNMYHNWVTAIGDGANADQFHGLDVVRPPAAGGPDDFEGVTGNKVKAGFSTYMQWLEQDAICRKWWEMAFREHRQCLEGLGDVRQLVKAIRAREMERGGA